jgi:glycosyltransferase involved in cell wall biosynthesis
MNIIHVVTNAEKVNFGIWNAALLGTSYATEVKQANCELWVCHGEVSVKIEAPVTVRLLNGKSVAAAIDDITKFPANDTIIVTHGCWGRPSKIGAGARKKGYAWIYTPHGMLEPWSMSQKAFKKKVYWNLIEKRLTTGAGFVRSVSMVENKNLVNIFSQPVVNVYNGVLLPSFERKADNKKLSFLFMARLHLKKGIAELVEAWKHEMGNNEKFELIIAGPDDGELTNLQPHIGGNIKYVGPVYGDEKRKLLKESHYYILPSKSEGFPTSVIEAMSYGMIPVISKGCNFPDVFEKQLGYEVGEDVESIRTTLAGIRSVQWDNTLSTSNYAYVKSHFSEEVLGEQLYKLYKEALK